MAPVRLVNRSMQDVVIRTSAGLVELKRVEPPIDVKMIAPQLPPLEFTVEGRAEVLSHSVRVPDEDCGYDLDSPKHPTYLDRMVD